MSFTSVSKKSNTESTEGLQRTRRVYKVLSVFFVPLCVALFWFGYRFDSLLKRAKHK